MSTDVKISLAEYEARVQRGDFDGLNRRRVELIYGEIRDMSPAGDPHDVLIGLLGRWSYKHTPDDVIVRIQVGLRMAAQESIPETDVIWIKPGAAARRKPKPTETLLVIEISDSTLANDLALKRDLYAAGKVPEYWVFDVPNRQVHLFRNPSRGAFQQTFVASGNVTIAPESFPEALLNIGELFRAVFD